MKKMIGLFVFLIIIGGQIVNAQSKLITGTVTSSDDGLGMPGVAVVIKGTTIGTSTDLDGKYSIATDAKDVLLFSFVGMQTKEVKVGNQAVINVQMASDVFGLDEIIVSGVASGTSKKKLSVSVSKVGAERLEDVPATSAASALAGKVAGVSITSGSGDPGGASRIQLRGATQLVGSQDPLIILDGVLMEGSLGDINVDDIKSMEVVKGASASALYGSRAGNGVIVITTKRGKALGDGETSVRVRNEFGYNTIAEKYDLAEHHAYELAPDYQDHSFTKYAGVTYPDGYLGGKNNSIIGSRKLSDDHYMDNPYGKVYDHQDEMFEGNSFYTNYISVANRSGKTNFLASFENHHQGGVIDLATDGYDRQSFRLNVDHDISDKLSFSASNLFIKTESDDPGGANGYNGGIFFDLLLAQPDVNLFLPNPDGQPYLYLNDQWSNTTNPLYELWKEENEDKKNRFLGSYELNYRPTNWMRLEAKYAFEKRDRLYTTYNPYDTYTELGDGTQGYTEGAFYKFDSNQLAQTLQTTIHLNKDFNELSVRGKLSFLYEDNEYESFEANGAKFGVAGVKSFDAIKGDKSFSSYKSQVIAKNYFGIVSLDYKDRYIFDGMFRMDGSSLFGEDERWNSYYRISGAYRLSKDVTIPGVQELKLRAAYGTAGQRPGFSSQYEVMAIQNGVASKSSLGNTGLKPSHSQEMEIGLDAQFLNRFDLELVYSKTTTDDQFLEAPQPVHLGGWPSQWINAGELETKTIEANLGVRLINNSKIRWSANVVFDRTRAKITRLDIPAFQTGPEGQEANKLFYIREGETFGVMYGADWVRSLDRMSDQLAAGESINDYVVNSDGYVIKAGTEGTINEAPIKKKDENGDNVWDEIGDANPDFKMGFSTNFSYKNFSAYLLIDWKQGGDVYNKTAQWLTRDSRSAIMDQTGKAPNAKKALDYYQTFYDVNDMNSYWVEDGTYVKLRELSLYYTLKKEQLSGLGFVKEIKFGVIGRNLLTFTDYSGYDPEVATQTSSGSQAFSYDFMGYPNYRTFSASIEFKF